MNKRYRLKCLNCDSQVDLGADEFFDGSYDFDFFCCCKECEDELWIQIDPDMDNREQNLELGVGGDRPDWVIELEEGLRDHFGNARPELKAKPTFKCLNCGSISETDCNEGVDEFDDESYEHNHFCCKNCKLEFHKKMGLKECSNCGNYSQDNSEDFDSPYFCCSKCEDEFRQRLDNELRMAFSDEYDELQVEPTGNCLNCDGDTYGGYEYCSRECMEEHERSILG